ncbi:MAG: OmpH family outer membrane protein [Desulfovibrio sp.]|jgi:Skp family chaperone for outer membrane proteins|nr:OmpH family outer membrane protein [Desulfovibrio sp.]
MPFFTHRLLLPLPLLALLSGCLPWGEKPPAVVVVDVERVLRESKAAEAGRAHLDAVKERLQKGLDLLREAVEKDPADQRERSLAEGLQTLRRQVALEEAAANRVVNGLLLEAVRRLRAKNRHTVVIARQNLLDAEPGVDVTDAVLADMNAGAPPVFAALPEVTVVRPDRSGDAGEKKTPLTPGKPQGNR